MNINDLSNKDVIDKLISYYRKQDIEVIYRMLANALIDYNRMDIFDLLDKEEKTILLTRIGFNARALRKFMREGGDEQPLVIKNVEDL